MASHCRIARIAYFVVALATIASGCRDLTPDLAGPAATPFTGSRGALLAELAGNPEVGTPVGVSEVEMDVPPAPRDYDQSDGALESALDAAGRFAFVGIKPSTNSRALQTLRVKTDSMNARHPRVTVAVRGPITAADAVAALNALSGLGLEVDRYYERLGVARVNVPHGRDLQAIRTHPNVDYIEPDIARFEVAGRPTFKPVLALRRSRSVGSHWPSSMSQTIPWGVSLVRAPDAWPYSTGAGARLLIVDSGYERGHEDLPYVPLANCVGPQTPCLEPVYPAGIPHGTHVTGSVAALDNSLGVVGVAKGVQGADLFVYGACNDQGGCTTTDLIASMNWATANLGSRGVINMSLHGLTFTQPYANAVAAAVAAGHVIVAATGNSGQAELRYPAAFTNVIGVAAVRPNLAFPLYGDPGPCPGSSPTWGPAVDFVGPWYALSTTTPNTYGDETTPPYWCGTSMATPHVAGIAALVRSRYPGWNAVGVFNRIRDTALDLGPAGWDDHYGFGLPRAHLAVTLESPVITAVIGKTGSPRLVWAAIPFATEYRIYRRITPAPCPAQWEYLATSTALAYVDASVAAASVWGYNSYPPSQQAVSYAVTSFAEGVETVIGQYATFLPASTLPC